MSCVERVRQGFAKQHFMAFLGARLLRVDAGLCEIEVPFRAELTQQHGFFHGGVVATLADNAGGFAGYSLMAEDQQPLSLEFKVNLCAKGIGDRLLARGRVLKNGRRVKVCQTDVFCCRGTEETLCATALVSVMAVESGEVEVQEERHS
jgi:uncharacterized protein (TIGR00369 family)